MTQETLRAIDFVFMLLNLACFFIIVGLNLMRMINSSKGEKGKADYYKFLSMKVSVITIIVVVFTVAVKTTLNF